MLKWSPQYVQLTSVPVHSYKFFSLVTRTWRVSRCRRIKDDVILFHIQLDEFGHKYTPLRLSPPSRPQTYPSHPKVFSHLLLYYYSVVTTQHNIYSISKCNVCNTVLSAVGTMSYPRSPELIYPDNWNFVSFDHHLPISPCPQPLATNILTSAYMSLTILDSTYKRVFVFLCLPYFT